MLNLLCCLIGGSVKFKKNSGQTSGNHLTGAHQDCTLECDSDVLMDLTWPSRRRAVYRYDTNSLSS
jgi:hypothetical protein